MTRLTTCADAMAVARRAADEVLRWVQAAREQRAVAHIALSGGSSPTLTYELLAREPERLRDVEVWFADERCVPPQEEQSNYRLASRALLSPAALPQLRIHRMEGELGPEEGARRYARELAAHVAPERSAPAQASLRSADARLPALDLVVLGIGPDGHVASLFPDAPTLQADAESLCLGVHDSPKPPPQRITLSLPVLRAARRCLLLASGAEKAAAIAAMLAEPSRHVPASLLRRERLTVIVDDAASPARAQS